MASAYRLVRYTCWIDPTSSWCVPGFFNRWGVTSKSQSFVYFFWIASPQRGRRSSDSHPRVHHSAERKIFLAPSRLRLRLSSYSLPSFAATFISGSHPLERRLNSSLLPEPMSQHLNPPCGNQLSFKFSSPRLAQYPRIAAQDCLLP